MNTQQTLSVIITIFLFLFYKVFRYIRPKMKKNKKKRKAKKQLKFKTCTKCGTRTKRLKKHLNKCHSLIISKTQKESTSDKRPDIKVSQQIKSFLVRFMSYYLNNPFLINMDLEDIKLESRGRKDRPAVCMWIKVSEPDQDVWKCEKTMASFRDIMFNSKQSFFVINKNVIKPSHEMGEDGLIMITTGNGLYAHMIILDPQLLSMKNKNRF